MIRVKKKCLSLILFGENISNKHEYINTVLLVDPIILQNEIIQIKDL